VRGDPLGLRDRALIHTRKPCLVVFRPKRPKGSAALPMPGGGYERVVPDKEGDETTRWLTERAFVAFALFYRLPGGGWGEGPDTPLQDAQRGVRLVRSRAAAIGFSPDRMTIMGFSAGGHVVARLTTRFAAKAYGRVDASDELSARPKLLALIYPVITLDPTFLLHAADDRSVPVENTLIMFSALKAQATPTEMHVFEECGHGIGLRFVQNMPVAIWPGLFETPARRHGV
jgi:acetyl esterase/lipase